VSELHYIIMALSAIAAVVSVFSHAKVSRILIEFRNGKTKPNDNDKDNQKAD
jgi:hypothetical protein